MWFLILLWLGLGYVFVQALLVEARRTSWTLLEGLLAANILGHVMAFPLSMVIRENGFSPGVIFVGLGMTIVCSCMAGGAIWVMRRLKAIEENRCGRRLLYLMAGLFLFPSMLAIPFNLFLGWIIWLPLWELNQSAAASIEKTERERDTWVPDPEVVAENRRRFEKYKRGNRLPP